MADIEQVYTIPLKDAKRVPVWRQSKRAIKEVREFLARHMRTPIDEIKIDNSLNEVIWARGNEKPPLRVRVRAVKFEDGGVEAEFAGER